MAGRRWLFFGAVLGVAVAFAHVPYLGHAARTLADTALSLVASGGDRLVKDVADAGVPKRVVLGVASLVSVLAPGVTVLLLVLAARGTLRLRAVVGLLLALLGAASFVYQSHGAAAEALILGLVVGGIAVLAAGPLVALPLAALGGLVAATYLPRLLLHPRAVQGSAVSAMHTALFARPGQPTALEMVLVLVALVPFVLALRRVVRR